MAYHHHHLPPYEDHAGHTQRYLRDFVLGVNDGLVSTFLLVAGVVGGSMVTRDVLLAGIAAALAGAISMAAGEYMATKSQDEAFQAELERERIHLLHYRDQEREELRAMFAEMGLSGDDLAKVVEIIDGNDDAMMRIMAGLEFGIVDEHRRNPIRAAISSGGLFTLGALPAVLPFAFDPSPALGLAMAALATGVGLFVVGVVKTTLTRRNPVLSGLENLAIGVGGGVASFLVGRLFGAVVA